MPLAVRSWWSVSTPPPGGIGWHGLGFEPLSTGIADPSPAQLDQLTACWERYRTDLPPDVKIELYGGRVRIEPGAFGARAELINILGGFLAGAVPDDQEVRVGPQVRGLDHARAVPPSVCPAGTGRVHPDRA
jgi:hypothetical protein